MSKSRSQSISDADEKKIIDADDKKLSEAEERKKIMEEQEKKIADLFNILNTTYNMNTTRDKLDYSKRVTFSESFFNVERNVKETHASSENDEDHSSSAEEASVPEAIVPQAIVPAEIAEIAEREEEAKKTFIQRYPVAGTIAVVAAFVFCGALLGFALSNAFGLLLLPIVAKAACYVIAASGLFTLLKPAINTINYWVKEFFSTNQEKEMNDQKDHDRITRNTLIPTLSQRNTVNRGTVENKSRSVTFENSFSYKFFSEQNAGGIENCKPEPGVNEIVEYLVENYRHESFIRDISLRLNEDDKKILDSFIKEINDNGALIYNEQNNNLENPKIYNQEIFDWVMRNEKGIKEEITLNNLNRRTLTNSSSSGSGY